MCFISVESLISRFVPNTRNIPFPKAYLKRTPFSNSHSILLSIYKNWKYVYLNRFCRKLASPLSLGKCNVFAYTFVLTRSATDGHTRDCTSGNTLNRTANNKMHRVSETCLFFPTKAHSAYRILYSTCYFMSIGRGGFVVLLADFMRHSAYRSPLRLPGDSFAIFSRPVNEAFHCRLISVFEKHHTFRMRKGNNGRSSRENRAWVFVRLFL